MGVVGLGGLGHMAVKFLKAFGCEVTVISTSPGKREEALGHLGAHKFVVSRDEAQVTARPPARPPASCPACLAPLNSWPPARPPMGVGSLSALQGGTRARQPLHARRPRPLQMKAASGTLHGILDTVSAPHNLATYMSLLRINGKYVLVGIPPEPYQLPVGALVYSEWALPPPGGGAAADTAHACLPGSLVGWLPAGGMSCWLAG